MKILLISDIHNSIENIKKLREVERDVTFVAGDLVECGILDVNKFIEVLEEIAHQTFTVYVPGNCDPPDSLTELNVENSINVHRRFYKIENYIVIGHGGSNPTPFFTPIELPEDEIYKNLEEIFSKMLNELKDIKISENVILLTHSPPKDTLIDITYMGLHVGSESIRRIIEKYQPLISMHGHIHEAQGMDKIGDTVCINCGSLKMNRYAIIEIKDSQVKVELKKF